jgi:hypothetical protein
MGNPVNRIDVMGMQAENTEEYRHRRPKIRNGRPDGNDEGLTNSRALGPTYDEIEDKKVLDKAVAAIFGEPGDGFWSGVWDATKTAAKAALFPGSAVVNGMASLYEEAKQDAETLKNGTPAEKAKVLLTPPGSGLDYVDKKNELAKAKGGDYAAGTVAVDAVLIVASARLVNGGTASNTSSNVLLSTSKQLQAKFKHASDFGVSGNYNKANAGKFSSAINQHINSTGVQTINGTYRGQPVIHYLNPNTGLNVISSPTGQFISGWKLNSTQLQNVLQHGDL